MQNKLRRIDTSTLHERAYQHLKQALMSGVFRPGEAVTLRGVSEALGTSVMPVREAVRRLVSERALEMPTARSIRVPPMSRDVFTHLCHARGLIEGETAALAARHAAAPFADKIARLNDRFVAAVEAGEVKAMLAHNREFHFAIYHQAASPVLLSIIESLWLQSGPYFHFVLQVPQAERVRTEIAGGNHNRLVKAMRDRAPDEARDALRSDIFESAKLYLELF